MHVETQMAARGLRPSVALEIDGVQAILDLVADGVGAALLPPYAVARSLRPSAYLVTPLASPGLRIPVSVALSRARPTTRTLQAALDLLHAVAPSVARP
jgi:LysR family nitrogen assimilation transcriptional regulator